MILADTSIWADHFRKPDSVLLDRLEAEAIVIHTLVIGEVALGHLRRRAVALAMLRSLRRVRQANERELLELVEVRELVGRGVGVVDAHLLASVSLTAGTRLWTRDKRLRAIAGEMNALADLD